MSVLKNSDFITQLDRINNLFIIGKYKEAHQNLLKLDEENKLDLVLQSNFLILKSKIIRKLGKFDEALSIANIALENGKKLNNDLIILDAIIVIINILFIKGDIDAILDLINSAENILKNYENLKEKQIARRYASIIYGKGSFFHLKGESNRSLEYYNESKEIFEKIEDEIQLPYVLNSIGRIKANRGKIEESLGLMNRGLELRKRIGNPLEIALALDDLSLIYFKQKRFEKALDYCKQCLIIYHEYGSFEHLARIYNSLGMIYSEIGELTKALEYYNEALGILKQKGNDLHVAVFYHNAGIVYRKKGSLDKALDYLQEGLTIFQKLGNLYLITSSFYNLGVTYYQKCELDKALTHMQLCYQLKEHIRNSIRIGNLLFYLILITTENSNLKQAKAYLSDLKELNDKSEVKMDQILKASKAILLYAKNGESELNKIKSLLIEVIEDENLEYELLVIALVNLCKISIDEIYKTGNMELLEKLELYSNKLINLGKKHQSIFLLSQSYWLKAHLASMKLDFEKSRALFNQAQLIAEEFDIKGMSQKISIDLEILLANQNRWEQMKDKKESIAENIKLAQLDGFFTEIFLKDLIENKGTFDEQPVMLIFLSNTGLPIFTKHFTSEEDIVDDSLFSGFLVAINNFIRETFKTSGSIERIKHHEYFIIIQTIEEFLICYVFKGQSYTANQRLMKFIEMIRPNYEIWNILTDLANSSKPMDSVNRKIISDMVDSIFP